MTMTTTIRGSPEIRPTLEAESHHVRLMCVGSRTPTDQSELDHQSGHVAVEDLDQGEIHVDGLQRHPGEWGQQEVVQEEGGGLAQTRGLGVKGEPRVQQEDQVQQEQRQTKMDQDLRGRVLT